MEDVVLDEIVLKCFYNICNYYKKDKEIITKYLQIKLTHF